MKTPYVCGYCEQRFEDGDIVHVNHEQNGQMGDVLHSVIDDLVTDEDMNACREMSVLRGKGHCDGLMGVYYRGELYELPDPDDAEFEMNDTSTAHRVTNIDVLAFKLQSLKRE